MCPHPNDLYDMAIFQYLIHETMLNIDSTGVGSGQITNEFLVTRRSLEGILFEDLKEFLRL